MNKLVVALVVIILIITLATGWKYRSSYKEIHIEGSRHQWYVLSEYSNSDDAARLMARLNGDVMKFLSHLQNKYHIDETLEDVGKEGAKHSALISRLKYDQVKIVSALLDNYNFETIYENKPKSSKDTSYTVQKGKSMHMCLRRAENPEELVDYDILLFVWLHEASHIANYNSYGHDDKFWTIFKMMLFEAKECGIYTPVDYSKKMSIIVH